MTKPVWPTIRRRMGTIVAYFGVAALFALVAVLLAWRPAADHFVNATFPAELSHSEGSIIIVSVSRDDHDGRDGHDGRDEPVDAKLTLLQVEDSYVAERLAAGDGRVVSTSESDDDGLGRLELPPIGSGIDVDEDDRLTLVVKVEAGGQTHYLRRNYDAPPRSRLLMTLDRPLYQPGQTIDARVLSVGPDSGQPVVSPIEWEVRDPRGNIVKRTSAKTSEMGISTFSFTLASEGVQGQYDISARGSDVTETRSFEVRPFRLPRFTVDVLFGPDYAVGGEPALARVAATYVYGEPVVNEAVEVEMSYGSTRDVVRGVTDEEGTFTFELPTAKMVGNGRIVVDATVQTEAGRMVDGSAEIVVRSPDFDEAFRAELIPSRRSAFLRGTTNIGYLSLTQGGKPAAGVEVRMNLPEEETERTISVTTDEAGLARFEWEPMRDVPVSIFVGRPAAELTVHPPMESNVARLEPRGVSIVAGQTVEADFYQPHGDEPPTGAVVLHRDGTPVALGHFGQDGVARVDVPQTARGLYWLARADGSDNYLRVDDTQIPIWVSQPGGRDVMMSLGQESYRPGEVAELELSFPSKLEGDQQASQVAFGVVGVDKALYALAERPEDRLSFAMKGSSAELERVERALAHLSDKEVSKAPADVGLARYLMEMQGASATSLMNNRHHDLTAEVHRASRAALRAGWVVFCLSIILVLTMLALRATKRSLERRDFSWKRLGLNFGLVIASFSVAASFLTIGGEDGFMGGLVVWLVVSIAWFLGASWRLDGERESLHWILYALGTVWIWGCAVLGSEEVLSKHSEFSDVFISIGTALPLVLWLFEALLWSFAFWREKEWRAGLALVSFIGLALGGGLLMVSGSRYDKDAAEYMMVQESRVMPATSELQMAGGADDEGESTREPAPYRGPPGAGVPEADEPADAGPRVRSWFPETMVWIGEVLADETGVAKLPIEFPDSITTWRINAWANTSDGRFGTGELDVRTIQEFFVEVEVPTHLTSGDVVEVPVVLTNRGSEPVMARLEVATEGALKLRRRPASQVVVAPGQRALLRTTVFAATAGQGAIVVTASGEAEGGGDAVRRPVTVEPDGPTLADVHSGIVRDGFERSVDVPFDAMPGTVRLDVSLYPSVTADALEGLDSMLRQPMGCFEQTSSANYPNVLVLRALERSRPSDWPGGATAWKEAYEKASEFAELGYQRMLSFQHTTGGFSLYPGETPDPMLTAYGLMQFDQLSDVAFVDRAAAMRAARWLESQQNANGSWPVWAESVPGGNWRSEHDVGQVRATSFVVIGLAPWRRELRSYRTLERALDRIEERLPSVESTDTLAYAATALLLGERREAANEVLGRLVQSVERDGSAAYFKVDGRSWMGGTDRYADIETTAVAAWALVESGSHAELLGPMVEYLADNRSRRGGWGTTQSTAWTLRAFEKLRESEPGEVDVTLRLDDEPLPRAVASEGGAGVATVGGDAVRLLHAFSTDELATGSSRLEVRPAAGETMAMVHAVTRYAAPWGSRSAARRESGTLQVEWNTTMRDYQFGKPVEVVATVNNPTADWVPNAIVELPIPPGAFVDLDELRERFDASRVEMVPTHVRVYVDSIAPRSREVFPYTFVPMVRGRVSMPAMKAYPFYNPLPVTEIDAGDVSVR